MGKKACRYFLVRICMFIFSGLINKKITNNECSTFLAAPILIVSNRYYIRHITTTGSRVNLLKSHLNNAVAIDFYWDWDSEGKNNKIFWSDVTSRGSNISVMDLGTQVTKVWYECIEIEVTLGIYSMCIITF